MDRLRVFSLLSGALFWATIASPPGVNALGQGFLPSEVVERARAYLVSHVGESYTSRNYEYQADYCSLKSRSNDISAQSGCDQVEFGDGRVLEFYFVRYRYLPWAHIDAPDPWVHVRVPADPGRPASGYIGTFDQADHIVDPTVSRSEAEAKMRAAVPESKRLGELRLVVPGSQRHASPQWIGSFTIEEHGDSWISRSVSVNAVTGEVEIEADVTGVACPS